MRDTREEYCIPEYVDAITGLNNRSYFYAVLADKQRLYETCDHPVYLCYIDIDQFRTINLLYGHDIADQLLEEVAIVLSKVKSHGILARLGNDEFGLLYSGTSADEVNVLVSELHQAVNNMLFKHESNQFEVSVSIGVVSAMANEMDKSVLLSIAEDACEVAKQCGGGHTKYYRYDYPEMHVNRREAQWIPRIISAMTEDRVGLYAQEIVSITAPSSCCRHFEVLVRMFDGNGNVILPGEFLPCAEKYGLIRKIDYFVLHKTLETISRNSIASRLDDASVTFSINLSGTTISQAGVIDYVHMLIHQFSIPPDILCFEVTETAAISNMKFALEFVDSLKNLGCRFSMDDFGTGLSSLEYLQKIRFDFIKIDRSFIRKISENKVNQTIVRAIQTLAETFGIAAIAEGIEDIASLEIIQDIGIEWAQGHLLYKPAPIEALFAEI